jgi:hypothetical protein
MRKENKKRGKRCSFKQTRRRRSKRQEGSSVNEQNFGDDAASKHATDDEDGRDGELRHTRNSVAGLKEKRREAKKKQSEKKERRKQETVNTVHPPKRWVEGDQEEKQNSKGREIGKKNSTMKRKQARTCETSTKDEKETAHDGFGNRRGRRDHGLSKPAQMRRSERAENDADHNKDLVGVRGRVLEAFEVRSVFVRMTVDQGREVSGHGDIGRRSAQSSLH